MQFTGIPHFAPELFRRAQLRDPLKLKALQKGLAQLSEEGATQFFKPLMGNDLILGAVGILQFDVVAYRLKNEYGVESAFEKVNVQTARWVHCEDARMLDDFSRQLHNNLALDGAGLLVYLAPSRVNLQLTEERWPDIRFSATRKRQVRKKTVCKRRIEEDRRKARGEGVGRAVESSSIDQRHATVPLWCQV